MMYYPGTHLIASIQSENISALAASASFKQLVDDVIKQHSLQKLGEVYHDFSPAGFTGVICLSESHISIHTWPEYGKVNLDIYLSNYQKNNEGAVHGIYQSFLSFFDGVALDMQTLKR
ncbi:adenosylmethionine decarboxylase [Foetidibacter luteolus]|uniref:adenosylmethionine decarboxylase n=1 Tax=Foetidibacter luteolus TaxID=2608880 RepID=UPI00129A88D7|nr:adenosylmethionine decarboxylase [Foetidibacter luteolus]